MTTVITDGLYMIADKRLTHTFRIDLDQTVERVVSGDYSVKIVQPEFNFLLGQRVAAIGFSGVASMITSTMTLIKKTEDLDQVFQSINLLGLTEKIKMEALVVMTDGYIYLVKVGDIPVGSPVTYNGFRAGSVVAIGSGSALSYHVAKLSTKRIHLQDIFLFLVHFDDSSSVTHDAWSLAQNLLVTDIPVTKEQEKAAVDRFEQSVQFYRENRKDRTVV